MKRLLNKKGYTLTYAIIVIGLLLILTGSVTFVSYYNLKTSRVGGNVNTSFYANDGALEEALTELSVSTYNAEVDAWNRVTNPNLLVEPDWELFLNALYEDVNNDVFSIDFANELVAKALKGEFEATFYNALYNGTHASHEFFDGTQSGNSRYLDFSSYTLTVGSPTNLNTTIINVMEDEDIVNDSTKKLDSIVTADTDPVITVSGFSINSDGSFSFEVKSNGEYHKYEKEITVNITISAPQYTFSVAMLQESIALSRNRATDQSILANGDIVFAEGTTNITGDIYAYGDTIDVKYDQDRNTYGGIVVGYESVNTNTYNSTTLETDLGKGNSSATVNLTGDIATRNSIKLETSNSALNVNMLPISEIDRKGNIFANAVHVREEASDTVLTVDNDLYMYADLYIAGDNSTVTVGTTDPVHNNALGRDVFRPAYGGIYALHSDNFGAVSEYTRTGTIIISTKASTPSITANGVYLYGVMRYNAYDKGLFDVSATNEQAAYQSGESITTYKNSQYYQSLLSNNIYQNGVFASLKTFADAQNSGILYDLITFGLPGYSLDQVRYRSNHFYTMGYYASTDTGNIYQTISTEDKNIVTIRDAQKDASEDYYAVATTGVLAFNGKVVNNSKTIITGAIDNLSKSILGTSEHVDEKISLLGSTWKNASDLYVEVALWDDWFNSAADVPLVNVQSSEIALYNSDDTKDVFLNMSGPAGSISILGLETNNETFTGTLISEGDIYINADAGENVTFTGNIISKKNIYFIGAGTKNIIHDELEIYKAINDHEDLKDFYDTENGKKIDRTSTSKDPAFTIRVLANNAESEKVRLNYVSDAQTDGTNIVDSNSITINSWRETN